VLSLVNTRVTIAVLAVPSHDVGGRSAWLMG
jgi:hypothetical protein